MTELTRGEKISLAKTRHGESKDRTPEYETWVQMVNRCTNARHHAYDSYGGRGITVDPRWLGKEGYNCFLEDMGRRPGPEYSLDRKKNELGYYKDNCRWATRKEQQNNRRTNHHLTFNGKTMTVSQWSEELGLHPATITSRLRRGYTMEQVLDPVRRPGGRGRR